jgi:23S rRNA pseudouridine1911/1915/1917 synthase
MVSGQAPGDDDLEVLYEDNHLIAVFKPAGVLTQGDSSGAPSMLDGVREYIRRRDGKPGNVFLGLVHRLDRPVAGVLLLAKTSKGASRIAGQIRERQVTKTYWALTQGAPRPDRSTLSHFLRSSSGRSARVFELAEQRSKPAVLDYRIVHRAGEIALLEIDLVTGRKHQIRAQLAHIGYPILGDVRYGANVPFVPGCIALVARRLVVSQPISGEPLSIEVPDRLCAITAWLRQKYGDSWKPEP